MKETADRLQVWVKVKRQCALTDAHVQMARELGTNPKRLTATAGRTVGSPQVPLAQHIEDLDLRRFKRTIPEPVAPVRQLLRGVLGRERAEARGRRRRKRPAEREHLEATRVSMLTLRRMYGGLGAGDDLQRLSAGGQQPRSKRRC